MTTTTNHTTNAEHRKQRAGHLGWVRLGDLTPHPKVQRELSPAWVNQIAANFDLEALGFPVVSRKNGICYLLDGQHRAAAMRVFKFAEDDLIQCEIYDDLTEEEEARLFLDRNKRKAVGAYDQFIQLINANDRVATEIQRTVLTQNLKLTRERPGVSAVVALRKVYDKIGAVGLGKVLRIIRDSYGDVGFDSPIIVGLGLFLHRHGALVDEDEMTNRLKKTMGGLNGLLLPAQKVQASTGAPKVQCIAAEATIIYNRDQKQGKKLQNWWKE